MCEKLVAVAVLFLGTCVQTFGSSADVPDETGQVTCRVGLVNLTATSLEL
jgi:hypothetical protein